MCPHPPASMRGMNDLFEPWSEFNLGLAGATAALAGLAIVAASVNIREIVASRPLVARLGSGIANLLLALAVTAFGLIPALDLFWYGILVLVVTAIGGAFAVGAGAALLHDPNGADVTRLPKALVGFLPIAAYAVAGVLALAGVPAALYVAAAAAILAIVSAVVVSWVALVEVLR
jgi:hypothetical protein